MLQLPQPDSNQLKTPLEKRKQWLLIFLMVIIIAAMASATWWYFNSRNVQSTDDAYVMGNQVTISSQVNGSVVSVNYTNTDLVQQGDVLVNLDDTDANLKFKKIKNKLTEAVRKTKQNYISDVQYNFNITQIKYLPVYQAGIRHKKNMVKSDFTYQPKPPHTRTHRPGIIG